MTSRFWAQGLSGLVYPLMFGPTLLGPQLVLNGDFGNAAGWNLGAGYAISGGQLVCASGAVGYAWQPSPNQLTGQTYQYDFDIVAYTSGQIRAYVGSSPVFGTLAGALGHFTGAIVAASPNEVGLQIPTSFVGTVDNFSIRQLG